MLLPNRSGVRIACVLVALAGLVGVAPAQAQSAAPEVRCICPLGNSSAPTPVPTSFAAVAEAHDDDDPSRYPTRYRVLLVPAVDGDGDVIETRSAYDQVYEDVIRWDDERWSAWSDYPASAGVIEADFAGLAPDQYYFLALQVMDADGAVSLGRTYGREVVHIRVTDFGFRPAVALFEPYLGVRTASVSETDIAAGQPLNFSWTADAEPYCGEILSLRHGWDLIDPDDPDDPGWAVAPGLEASNFFAPERAFSDGLHAFHLRAEDTAGRITSLTWYLRVIPYVDLPNQLPLLVLDQVVDATSQAWLDQAGNPRDNEIYRNAFWHFLAEGSGGVAGINWARDWYDHRTPVGYEDVVQYRAVLCLARASSQQQVFEEFRPQGGVDRYVWLTPYQYRGGNLFLVGNGSMESFLEALPNYVAPVIFDTDETVYMFEGRAYVLGFGTTVLPDGAEVPRGPRLYPYATAGIAALDWTSTASKYIYARSQVVRFDRADHCVGLKGIALDGAFRAAHLIGPGVIPDTTFTHPDIDWHDVADAATGSLTLLSFTFPFRDDEFIDADISGERVAPILPQECVGPEYPAEANGLCVEPMFRGVARFDWLRERRWAEGETDWPYSRYEAAELDVGCGAYALTDYEGIPRAGARTNGQVYGHLSHRMVPDKPVSRADVYWGFDPYRFEHENIKQAIRWVLGYFGLDINP